MRTIGYGFPSSAGDTPIGVVLPYIGTTAPKNWLMCDGLTVIDAGKYPVLHAMMLSILGQGVPIKTPDMRGRVPVGKDNMGGTSANRVTGAWADSLAGASGAETHTLTTAELPAHVHDMTGMGSTSGGAMTRNYDTSGDGSVNTGSAGGGGAHNNMQPSITMNYIIKAA